VLCTLTILNQLGVNTSHSAKTLRAGDTLMVEGVGPRGLQTPKDVLYCGNSGTAMRLLLGLVSGANLAADFTGDASLNKRPMERVLKPLQSMGGSFATKTVHGERYIQTLSHDGLNGMVYDSPVASAQVKTAILLAGLNAKGETVVNEPLVSRNHTELLLKAMGAPLEIQGTSVRLKPTTTLKPIDIHVPGDISSAAFFIVAALITPNSNVLIRNVNLNPTRTGLLDVLQKMGADIAIENQSEQGGEPVGDLRVKTSQLKNGSVGGDVIPRLIDEIPILALAASLAEGEMLLSDAQELRVKETDRIKAVVTELSRLGAEITETKDGFRVRGVKKLHPKEKTFSSYYDHRIAMMLIVAGLQLDATIEIDDVSCINTSFPEFFRLLQSLKSE
jgi:3-phosphoshikimate 1-carboxyvinyltransferase